MKYLFQNIITKQELEDENYSLMTEVTNTPDSKRIKLDYTADYKKLISLLLGSLYVNFQSQTFSNADHIKKTSKRLTGGASQIDTAEFPVELVLFTELKSKPPRVKQNKRLFTSMRSHRKKNRTQNSQLVDQW